MQNNIIQNTITRAGSRGAFNQAVLRRSYLKFKAYLPPTSRGLDTFKTKVAFKTALGSLKVTPESQDNRR